MKKTLLMSFLFILATFNGWGQVTQPPGVILVGTAPSGACTAPVQGQMVTSTGAIWTCQAGTWTIIGGGSGTFTTLSGDATSTPTGGATTVVGLKNNLLPSLTTGYLNWTGSAWALTTVSGGGDTITSPNSTLGVGGTSTNTTLDVLGSAGKILAGATPALTFTPALGVDNTSAGTLQLANGAANAHTIWGSAATTSNTINGFATVPTTGHLIDCTVTSTTCLLHDSGVVTSNVVSSASSLTSNALMTGAGGQASQTITTGTGVTTALGVNTGTAGAFGVVIAHGSTAMGTGSITTSTCATVVTATATGVASTDAIIWNPNGSIKGISGYTPGVAGGLSIAVYPTTNTINFDVCNWESVTVTPGALTINWAVLR